MRTTFKSDDFSLFSWTNNLRKTKDQLSREQINQLDLLGFNWGTLTEIFWEKNFHELLKFKQAHGHLNVPKKGKFGEWVKAQRSLGGKGNLSRDRRYRLDEIGFIWDLETYYWEVKFSRLVAFKNEHGDINVSRSSQFKDIGLIVSRFRQTFQTLSEERQAALIAIGFRYAPRPSAWEHNFNLLVEHKNRYGDCLVSDRTKYPSLNRWIVKQRGLKKDMSQVLIDRLDSIGFVWDAPEFLWNEGFAALSQYKSEHGSCAVPQGVTYLNGKRLDRWSSYQRRNKLKLTERQIGLLNSIGYKWH